MRYFLSNLWFGIFVFYHLSCSGDGATDEVTSAKCDLNRSRLGIFQRYCAEYGNLTPEQLQEVKKICLDENGGLWQDNSRCSTTGLVGQCHFSNQRINFSYFYYDGFDENSALENCLGAGGRFAKSST